MNLARSRIRCGESGHMWEDAPFFVVKNPYKTGLREVWERNQQCVRPGCERTRKDRVHPRTFQLLGRTYGGKLEKIGRMSREGMRLEIIEEQ